MYLEPCGVYLLCHLNMVSCEITPPTDHMIDIHIHAIAVKPPGGAFGLQARLNPTEAAMPSKKIFGDH